MKARFALNEVEALTSPPCSFSRTDRPRCNRAPSVFGLVAGIGGDVATSAEVAVVGRPVVDVCVRPTPGKVAVLAPAVFGTDPAANLDAHVGARDVIKFHTVQAANLHVLDELKTRGPAIFNDGGCDAAKTTARAIAIRSACNSPH